MHFLRQICIDAEQFELTKHVNTTTRPQSNKRESNKNQTVKKLSFIVRNERINSRFEDPGQTSQSQAMTINY